MEPEIKGYANKIIEEMDAKMRAKMSKAKKKFVTARLTQDQYDELSRGCAAKGIKVSRFCEESLLVAMRGLAV